MVGPVRDTDHGGTEGRERSAMVRVARRGPKSGVERVTEHRFRQSAGGAQRVELTVPTEHVKLIRAVAKMLRASDAGNDEVLALQRIVGPEQRPARTGAELLAFFRSSPLVGEDLDFRREDSAGRPVDLS